ncbi:hypothetical protein L208DRAFT_1384420 [Tricholoma matsutake]|nr:hypothetical protein L208DRAFT_1384420 [Tricholoma matsutake 945]
MKISQLFLAAALAISPALADFHIVKVQNHNNYVAALVACPSQYYGCPCFDHTVNGQLGLVNGQPIPALPSGGFMSVRQGLCGHGQLDLYQQKNKHWKVYEHSNKGFEGTCYLNTHNIPIECPDHVVYEELVCITSVCD